MAAYSKIIYIYIEDFDLGAKTGVQEQKHQLKGREFTAIQYTREGKFEPALPSIEGNTKVILEGHCGPMADNLEQLGEGGGIQLHYQTIADELAKKMAKGERVHIALYGCRAGVGESREEHSTSFAGKLFKALVKKGLKPHILAYLLPISNDSTGKILGVIPIRKMSVANENYQLFAQKFYPPGSEAELHFKNFQKINRNRENIFAWKAQGSKVELSYNADHPSQPNIRYPHGHPNKEFAPNDLNNNSDIESEVTGKAGLQVLLSKEIILAHNFKEDREKVREELRKIFEAFELAHPNLGGRDNQEQERIERYAEIKDFLLTEDYYVDVALISQFIAAFLLIEEEALKALIGEIEKNEVLKNIGINDKGQVNTPIPYDLDAGYLQLGLDVIKNKIVHYPSPLSEKAFSRLGASTQKQLAIELGKQLVCHQFDAEFVRYYSDETPNFPTDDSIMRPYNPDVISLELRINSELAKRQRGLEYDEQFLQFICKDSKLTSEQVAIVGKSFIESGFDSSISHQAFRLLNEDEQKLLALWRGRVILNRQLSEEAENDMEFLIQIASDLLAEKQHQDAQDSQATASANPNAFFPSALSNNEKAQLAGKNHQPEKARCTIL